MGIVAGVFDLNQRPRDCVAHIRARSAWPHPLRRSTDRVAALTARCVS